MSLYSVSCVAVIFAVADASLADEPADELVQLVVNLLGEEDKDLRALALEQVRTEAKGQTATRQFAAQLPKLPPASQVGLLSALADRGDGAAQGAVLNVLATSRNESVRVAAIGALGSLGQPSDWRQLVQLLAQGSQAEQAAARTSLVRLRGESVPLSLAAAMKQTTPSVGVTLIEILATRRAVDTIPKILQAAVDANPAVRAAAMTALGQLAGPEHIPGMVQAVLRARKGAERAAAEKAVMFVCGRITDSQKRAEPLIAAMDKLKLADRTAMLSTLGRVGGSEALKIVDAAVANRKPAQHSEGIRALSNWPNASVASRLIKLAKTDKHPNHRTTALRALIRIAPLPDGRPDDQKLDLLQTAMAMCQRDAERNLVLQRAAAIRLPETLRFISPYMDQQRYAQQACATVVELAHHRNLREPNKSEFDRALDKVILTSKDATVVERANRYKKGQTWVRSRTPKPK